ncbi:hypothetical protein F4814DRAFT_446483 [Daldinia grandis]|nr:hypothetical protein F4814DRAFT_446483 [Daldinia grandis]
MSSEILDVPDRVRRFVPASFQSPKSIRAPKSYGMNEFYVPKSEAFWDDPTKGCELVCWLEHIMEIFKNDRFSFHDTECSPNIRMGDATNDHGDLWAWTNANVGNGFTTSSSNSLSDTAPEKTLLWPLAFGPCYEEIGPSRHLVRVHAGDSNCQRTILGLEVFRDICVDQRVR